MTDSTVKNLQRIVESVEQHDSNCEAKAKAVCLNPYEVDRLGFDSITTKSGRRVPIKPDDSLGTGRLRVVCDGYHGPKREKEQEETVEAPAPAERELVPVGAPEEGLPEHEEGGLWTPGNSLTMIGGRCSGKKLTMERMCLAYEEHHPNAERIERDGMVMYLDRSES